MLNGSAKDVSKPGTLLQILLSFQLGIIYGRKMKVTSPTLVDSEFGEAGTPLRKRVAYTVISPRQFSVRHVRQYIL